MSHTISVHRRGFTAIELLIIIAMSGVVAFFVTPILHATLFESELDKAVKITEASIQRARRTARYYKADVFMRLESDIPQKQNSIKLTVPKMQQDLVLNEMTEEFPFPSGVHIAGGVTEIRFDSKGEVEWPTMIMIVSNYAEGERQVVEVD